ncbi:universal stress protein [uncultured Sulfitobacter sp.]|uniref:universal stress protein n=1 Tax=uncultured Sulfitobacter sp. TaxID=191468 RepID=UPI00261CEC86|nr:universal stress protein [uncultured Sulfitobacter sp.]
MSVKTILVAYSGWSSAQRPLKHALKIANHHDAWLTGIVGHGKSHVLRLFAGQMPSEVFALLKENERKEIADAKDTFAKEVARNNRSHRSDFLDVIDEDGGTVASFSRTFDLVVTAPHTTARDEEHMSASPDLIALQSGRPVLIVPKEYDAPGLSTHVLVAWDGKRAAARAIGDAMPMLEEKGKVTVLTIGAKTPAGTDRLIQNLRHHGIRTDHLQSSKTGSIGNTILVTAQDIGADLIVMGAYEHSKFAHDVFGGVTTDVLEGMNVPVLMSH